jgi:hypothetical protein
LFIFGMMVGHDVSITHHTKYDQNLQKDKWVVAYTRYGDGRTDWRTRILQYIPIDLQ